MNSSDAKALLAPLLTAQVDFELDRVAGELRTLFSRDCKVQLAYPFEDLAGASGFVEMAYAPLKTAFPDLERRDSIVMAGPVPDSDRFWVGCAGHYVGTFAAPLLDIPPTGHLASLRYHEFYRIESGKVVEVQALWDLPSLMMQARAWPMSPSLGLECLVPSPSTQDGLRISDSVPGQGERSRDWVEAMLLSLKRSTESVEAMNLERYWHPAFNWYGPGGIGTCRGVAGFRNWHQIPFLNAMPDRGSPYGSPTMNLFGEGNYVGFTAWPGMQMTLTGDGFLGIAPSGQKLTMRSLDFWRCAPKAAGDDGLTIRENWVLVDILDVYAQIGVDVLARMREFNKARL